MYIYEYKTTANTFSSTNEKTSDDDGENSLCDRFLFGFLFTFCF